MSLQRVPHLFTYSLDQTWNVGAGTNATLDATGESCAVIGYISLEGGTASTKVISSSGGKIYWRVSTNTFANGGTNLRVGINDVSATTGLEDGTHDVYADLVGGTDTLTAGYIATPMETGTKTLTHGDLIAVVFELTARAGADSVQIPRLGPLANTGVSSGTPYGTIDTAGLAKTNQMPFAFIEFDDGTTGWIVGTTVALGYTTLTAFGSTSSPDEYIATFTPAFTCEVDAIGTNVVDIDATNDAFEIRLYSDPLGTPSVVLTITIDPDQTNTSGTQTSPSLFACTPTTLTAGTVYGIAIRPTSANTVSLGYIDLGSGNDKIKRMAAFGATQKLASRTDVTGAFSVVQDYYLPFVHLRISKLDDGAGSSGGGGAVIGAVGGVIH